MKRSFCASGKGYVPSCSIGFCVARTKNGSSNFSVWPPTVTECSCIASSSAASAFGGDAAVSVHEKRGGCFVVDGIAARDGGGFSAGGCARRHGVSDGELRL